MDVTDLLHGFETHNGVMLTMGMTTYLKGKVPTLLLQVTAWKHCDVCGDQHHLASASVICSDLNVKTMAAAFTRLLYVLDAKLASAEFAAVETKSA